MGFFIGFAPTSTASLFLTQSIKNLGNSIERNVTLNRSLLMSETPTNSSTTTSVEEEVDNDGDANLLPQPRELLIVITTTRPRDTYRGPFLRRLAHTLKLVSSPILWIVVEAHNEASYSDDLLRKSGIMYGHLTYKENFTDFDAEADHQRNIALNHIEYHRLNGIVHFAGFANIYDLYFFEEIREINMFGAWPVVMVSANRKRVMLEGPICSSSMIVGWQLKDLSNTITGSKTPVLDHETDNGTNETRPSKINISGFAFNSSVLWDPERWGRPSSVLDTSQQLLCRARSPTPTPAISSYCRSVLVPKHPIFLSNLLFFDHRQRRPSTDGSDLLPSYTAGDSELTTCSCHLSLDPTPSSSWLC